MNCSAKGENLGQLWIQIFNKLVLECELRPLFKSELEDKTKQGFVQTWVECKEKSSSPSEGVNSEGLEGRAQQRQRNLLQHFIIYFMLVGEGVVREYNNYYGCEKCIIFCRIRRFLLT